ncbi:MAG: recombinase family protein [Lachnospiraceae bacterium]|nr:recombinase family protein [Lachnospiraceae bacterium]
MSLEKPYAIYSRKSKYTGKGESIGNQIEMCRDYLRLHFGEEKAKEAVIYEDEGFSGGTLNRPRFQAMMEEARQGTVQAVVVYRLDRISRNIGDFAGLIRELEGYGIDFISVKEQFDTSSPMGRAMMYISSVFSQLERETIAERIRDNLHELAKTGRWLGGNTPTGYESQDIVAVTIDGKQKKACMLKDIPKELELIDLIYSKFLEFRALSKLDAFLLKNGFHTKNGNNFSRFAIRDILSNPVYVIADEEAWQYFVQKGVQVSAAREDFDGIHGIMAYNRTLQKKGKAHKSNPVDEWIVSVGKHEGRICGAMWVEVQRILEQNRSKSYRKPRSNQALLSGYLRCGSCGDYMRPKKGRIHKDGECPFFYLCTRKERSQKSCCAMKNLKGNEVDEKICEQLGDLEEDKETFIQTIEKERRELERKGQEKKKGQKSENQRSEITWRISENEEKIRRLVETLSMASKGAEVYILQQIDYISKENEKLEKERIQKAGQINEKDQEAFDRIEADLLVSRALSFEEMIKEMGVEQKRDMIRSLIKKVYWNGEEVHVFLTGSDDALMRG